jgi:hypothetical protein
MQDEQAGAKAEVKMLPHDNPRHRNYKAGDLSRMPGKARSSSPCPWMEAALGFDSFVCSIPRESSNDSLDLGISER